jgi:hypothetical protein
MEWVFLAKNSACGAAKNFQVFPTFAQVLAVGFHEFLMGFGGWKRQ